MDEGEEAKEIQGALSQERESRPEVSGGEELVLVKDVKDAVNRELAAKGMRKVSENPKVP